MLRSLRQTAVVTGLLLGAAACGEDSAATAGGADAGAAPLRPAVAADRNHDGVVTRDDVSATGLAVVLANLDDDDGDKKADVTIAGVDGDDDALDLAPILVLPGEVEDGMTGLLQLDAPSLPHLRLYRVQGPAESAASYQRITSPESIAITTEELRSGARFALEVDALAGMGSWSGEVSLSLQVAQPDGTVLSNETRLKVAPLLFQWNTAPTRQVFYTDADVYNAAFVAGLRPACAATGAGCTAINLPWSAFDQWTQDFFDVGQTSFPGPDGKPYGMKVIVRSAQPDRPAGQVMMRSLGKDVAVVDVHGPALQDDGAGLGYSMNSFGNWEVIPPYTQDGKSYPQGRNVWGSGADAANQPDPAFVDFVSAQGVQPPMTLDSSWLVVGHIDEFSAFVKSATPRGWRLLVARPSLARQMLLDLQAQGHGAKLMFEGKETYDFVRDPSGGTTVPASKSIDAVLADADLMAESQRAEVEIAFNIEKLRNETGLGDDEITPMPFLFERIFGAALAYQPGTVNLLHADGHVVIAKPFGPQVDGKDPFETDLESRLGGLGLTVHFVDNWELYHAEMGEVHCATNVSRDVNVAWWESKP